MNLKLKEIFRGKVVNNAHTINTGVDEFPRYVLEYLIDTTAKKKPSMETWQRSFAVSRRPLGTIAV